MARQQRNLVRRGKHYKARAPDLICWGNRTTGRSAGMVSHRLPHIDTLLTEFQRRFYAHDWTMALWSAPARSLCLVRRRAGALGSDLVRGSAAHLRRWQRA